MLGGGLCRRSVLLAEAIDAAGNIKDLVFAGVEGMAGRADIGCEVAARGAGRDNGAAGTGDCCVFVIGMDAGLHGFSRAWLLVPMFFRRAGSLHTGFFCARGVKIFCIVFGFCIWLWGVRGEWTSSSGAGLG